ncbi:MAG: nitroreductase family protein [candidate division KSB1 bacterium]|nr:nitroreductase family protein [candidate division KSB1 bacterium]
MSTTVIELLQKRKASRAISSQKLNDQIIDKLMNAAQLSASCYNNQPWRFLFLTEDSALEKGRKALSPGNSWAKTAPLLIAGFSKPDLDCQIKDGRNYYLFDLGMATQLILLQATELNLIARPMAGFSPEVIKKEFNLPPEYEVYVLIAVGYEGNIAELEERWQSVSTAPRTRNPLSQNFFLNKFV